MRTWIVPTAAVGGIALAAAALTVAVTYDGGPTARPAAAAITGPRTDPSTTAASTGTAATSPTRTITVTGEGVIKGHPDVMTVNLGVQTHDRTANGALQQASEKATTLLNTLKAAGVAEDDITTTNVSIWPQYDYAGQHITGYQASNEVVARLKDLTKAGSVIDAAASSVGDAITLSGVSFSIDDSGALKNQARVAAVTAARTQAQLLADAAGAKVGKVLTINEISYNAPTPVYYSGAVPASADKGVAVPLQPGTQQVTLDVSVVYELTD